MKLRDWLEKCKNISYVEFKELLDEEKSVFRKEHQCFLHGLIK